MKRGFLILMVSLLTTAAMAQVNKVPADTRLYLQTLENGNKQVRARSGNGNVKQKEAKLFVSCAPDADTKAIETQIKSLGARPHFRMNGGQLFIEGADDGTPMRIYTTDGRLVASTTLTGGCVSLPAASPAGVYAVQVGTLGSTLIRK